ncbi:MULTISPECIES: amino acid ABC transporter permease [Thalassospira]|jgi:polar amino acid transport system permease protein|uniref:Amino acid ABC transporter permease n=2 Tax=Thalassospira TaxID=168934 RepID=A0A358HM83_9PROT|nr:MULTISPECIES: amino acid ABC transporter permease [Thalassospira]PKR60435.1 amino acid ABC transporter permease [Thalassospira lohafexi]HBU96295.1 amino acid ABC transporter permease [Thalassospira lucentensis]HCW66015.1 amino acid ABC transporter permease [Thalassospira lucentensis]|tara:strand:- start:1966 stop:2637 length:672 start_codon:yes stop_codon:yes gene_type:complete
MIFETILSQMPYLVHGLSVAIALLVCLLSLGLVLGLLLSVAEVYGHWTLRIPCTVFERIFRGIPAIVLLLLFYYGVTDFIEMGSFMAAVLALGLRSAAYQSQIFRGAFLSVPQGQMMAARAMGMNKFQAIRDIVLPQALRMSIGPWTNEFSSELKATSLAYVIGVVELTRQAKYIISNTQGNILIVFAVVALMYFIVNRAGNWALYRLENRLALPGFEHRGDA